MADIHRQNIVCVARVKSAASMSARLRSAEVLRPSSSARRSAPPFAPGPSSSRMSAASAFLSSAESAAASRASSDAPALAARRLSCESGSAASASSAGGSGWRALDRQKHAARDDISPAFPLVSGQAPLDRCADSRLRRGKGSMSSGGSAGNGAAAAFGLPKLGNVGLRAMPLGR